MAYIRAHERTESVFSTRVNILDDLADLQRPCWCTKVAQQYGVSIQSSIKLRETFWPITQKRRTIKT